MATQLRPGSFPKTCPLPHPLGGSSASEITPSEKAWRSHGNQCHLPADRPHLLASLPSLARSTVVCDRCGLLTSRTTLSSHHLSGRCHGGAYSYAQPRSPVADAQTPSSPSQPADAAATRDEGAPSTPSAAPGPAPSAAPTAPNDQHEATLPIPLNAFPWHLETPSVAGALDSISFADLGSSHFDTAGSIQPGLVHFFAAGLTHALRLFLDVMAPTPPAVGTAVNAAADTAATPGAAAASGAAAAAAVGEAAAAAAAAAAEAAAAEAAATAAAAAAASSSDPPSLTILRARAVKLLHCAPALLLTSDGKLSRVQRHRAFARGELGPLLAHLLQFSKRMPSIEQALTLEMTLLGSAGL